MKWFVPVSVGWDVWFALHSFAAAHLATGVATGAFVVHLPPAQPPPLPLGVMGVRGGQGGRGGYIVSPGRQGIATGGMGVQVGVPR